MYFKNCTSIFDKLCLKWSDSVLIQMRMGKWSSSLIICIRKNTKSYIGQCT